MRYKFTYLTFSQFDDSNFTLNQFPLTSKTEKEARKVYKEKFIEEGAKNIEKTGVLYAMDLAIWENTGSGWEKVHTFEC